MDDIKDPKYISDHSCFEVHQQGIFVSLLTSKPDSFNVFMDVFIPVTRRQRQSLTASYIWL